jgi:hypothetical protein
MPSEDTKMHLSYADMIRLFCDSEVTMDFLGTTSTYIVRSRVFGIVGESKNYNESFDALNSYKATLAARLNAMLRGEFE